MANSTAQVHVGDIGTLFTVTLKDHEDLVVDISSATTKLLVFEKPNGDNLEKTALFTTDGTDGKLKYTTVSGDIDTAGSWRIQAKVVIPSGTFFSSVSTFEVRPNL